VPCLPILAALCAVLGVALVQMLTSPAPPNKKKESSDGGAATTEPLSLDDERQLRVRAAAHTGALQLGKCGVAHSSSHFLFIFLRSPWPRAPHSTRAHCLQLHYAIQMTQMAAILNLPTHVTVSSNKQAQRGPAWRGNGMSCGQGSFLAGLT
jgi:hypothetical protein